MSKISFEKTLPSNVWIALKRLDKNDDRVVTLREVSIHKGIDATVVKQVINSAFGLNPDNATLKIRNYHGCLMPLNSSILPNSKHMPYVLEVAKIFQHVFPRPRNVAMSALNRSMRTRLQSIDQRIQRLEELLPHIKLRHNEKLNQDIECLSQKLRFLHKRMQVADSHRWRGVLIRAPLW